MQGNDDYTIEIPHPVPDSEWFAAQEYDEQAAEDDMIAEAHADRAFAEHFERRAESGTWWGR